MDYREILRQSWRHRRGALNGRAAGADGRGNGIFAGAARPEKQSPHRRLRNQVYERLLRDLDSAGGDGRSDASETRRRVRRILGDVLAAPGAPSLAPAERSRVVEEVLAELRGLGPLDPLFADPTVSDVLVNGAQEVWVDRFGRLERTETRFDDDAHLRRLLGRLVSSHGRRLDEASPTVDVRLPDGSRLHAVIPPLSPVPIVSIRRPRAMPFRLEELYECGTLAPAVGETLAAAVRCGLNIVVSGGAASGKTTLLNVLSGFIPPAERVVTIEETAELRLDHPHVIALEGRPPNVEGRGEVTLRGLVRNALRMRPDRIIVGEVRGPEVFDMLQAMNTGHEGSLTTVHANSPKDALRRLENLVHIGGFELPSAAVRELLGAAIDLLVHTSRFLDGARRVTSVHEVLLVDDRLTTRELFRWDDADGHVATGVRPSSLTRLAGAGLDPEAAFPAAAAGPAAVEAVQ